MRASLSESAFLFLFCPLQSPAPRMLPRAFSLPAAVHELLAIRVMTPIFLAFHNAVGETTHVVLPRASPHATTHLPDSYVDSIDLSVFRNDAHSIARLRKSTFDDKNITDLSFIGTFENYVALSTVPGTSSKVYIHLPSGDQIELSASTHNETTWFILLDGAQFTYADLRCSIEFDYDHSISNSMRPPEVPRPTEHISVFEDSELIPDITHPQALTCDGSGYSEGFNTDLSDLNRYPNRAAETCASTHTMTIVNATEAEARQEYTRPLHNSDLELTCVPPVRHVPTRPSQILQPTSTNIVHHKGREPGEQSQVFEPTTTKLKDNTSRQQGEASQVLERTALGTDVRTSRKHDEELEVLVPTLHNPEAQRNAGEESQILTVSNLKSTDPSTRRLGEESQILQKKTVASSGKDQAEPSQILEKMQVRRTSFVNKVLDQDSNALDKSVPSHRSPDLNNIVAHKQKSASTRLQNVTVDLKSLSHSAVDSTQVNIALGSRRPIIPRDDSPDILHTFSPRKRKVSEVAKVRSPSLSSKASKRTKPATVLSDAESTSTDVIATSTVSVNVPSRRRNKRRRSLRIEADSINVPAKPIICFSTNCTIQTKKRTMDTFLRLGGTVVKDISDADLLCVPTDDGLRKTPKLILAVILGRIVVTENWVVQCARTGRFPCADDYQPTDREREREWGVKLPDALNQARRTDTELDQLFTGYTFYLTQSLQDQLSKTGNLEAFVKIGTSMGAIAVRKRLPVRYGPKLIVLGVEDDFDAAAVGKLGLPLYDKDLLTMSALRGCNEAEKDEFRFEIPVKEEELSQS